MKRVLDWYANKGNFARSIKVYKKHRIKFQLENDVRLKKQWFLLKKVYSELLFSVVENFR